MSDSENLDLTSMLRAAADGDDRARDEFVAAVYRQLHRIASYMMSRESPGQTLQATALVNEALMQLFGGRIPTANDRKHFLNVAAGQMRRILIDRARSKSRGKRKGVKLGLDEAGQIPSERREELVALDDALTELAKVDPAAADVVEKKFFGGYTDEETAEILNVSLAKVRRDWTYARAWLHHYLSAS